MTSLRLLRSALSLLFVALLFGQTAQARKLRLGAGMFSLSAENSEQSQTVSNLGAYWVSYHEKMLNRFELVAHYSLIMSDVISGDLSFGLGFGLLYYPMSRPGPMKIKSQQAKMESIEIWRPYFGLNFQERRFQSVSSSYAGFGFQAGTEYFIESFDMSLFADFRHAQMQGSQTAEASETVITSGLVIEF